MSLLIFEPLNDSMPVQLDLDFDLDDLGFRTLSSEAPPAEALEPSLSVTDDELSSPLSMTECDIWKNLPSDRSSCSSPVPRSVIEYLQEVEQDTIVKSEFDEDVIVKAEFDEVKAEFDDDVAVKSEFDDDLLEWSSRLQLRNDCMWASESTDLTARSVGKGAMTTGAAAAVRDVLADSAAAKCEPVVKREACDNTVVALSCGPVVTVAPAGVANGASVRTGTRPHTSLLNKSEVSLLKSNNRSLLISSRTTSGNSNANAPTSPVKNNSTSERVKVLPMWGPWLGAASANCFQRSALESDGDSPRPYTPPSQSESEGDEEEDHPRFKHSLDMVLGLGASLFECDDVDSTSAASTSSVDALSVFNCDLDLVDEAYAIAEAAEQMCRPVTTHSDDSGRPKSNSRKSENTSAHDDFLETSRQAFISDHSYHLSKGAVKTEHLGVQTPSDSEEEIDVVSVGEKQSSRASSVTSATALPTNPSARDRQQLQRTVASAITAKHHGGGSGGGGGGSSSGGPARGRAAGGEAATRGRIPVRFTLGERTVSVRSVTVDAYDCATATSADELSSPTRAGPGRKRGGGAGRGGAKRPRVQYQHRLQHHTPRGRGRRPRGDDSEPDPTEKRSLHNDMERQRRIDLRNLVDDLRKLVPDLKDNKRAAKVMILREAAKYCRGLREEGRALVAESAALRRQQDRMMSHLSSLRRDLAAQRM